MATPVVRSATTAYLHNSMTPSMQGTVTAEAGDTIVAIVALAATASNMSVSSGADVWEQVGAEYANNATNCGIWIGTAPSSGDVVVTTSWTLNQGFGAVCQLHLFSFVGAAAVDAADISVGAAGASLIAPAVNATVADGLLLCSWVQRGAGGPEFSVPPEGMTRQTIETTNTWMCGITATQTLTASGTTGTRTVTSNMAGLSHATASLVLKSGGGEPEHDTVRLYPSARNYDLEPTAPTSPMWEGYIADPPIRALYGGPSPSVFATGRPSSVSSPPYDVEIMKFVSGPAAQAGEIAPGDWVLRMACQESNADADMYWALGAWLMRPDGTRRAQLFEVNFPAGEWPAATAPLDSVAFNLVVTDGPDGPVPVDAGDRLVLEVGYRATGNHGVSRTGTIIYGGPGTDELQAGDTGSLLTSRPAFLDVPVSTGTTFSDPDQYARPPGPRFDLANWKITLPVEDPEDLGDALEVTQPDLDTLATEHFHLDNDRRMVFVAPTSGDVETTGGSEQTRSELREMQNGVEAAWSIYDPQPRSLTVTGIFDPTTITGGTQPRKEIIIGQIHGTEGQPPLYLNVEHTSGTAGNPVTPRLRVYKYNGTTSPGVGNTLSPLTATSLISYRIAYEPGADPAGGTGRVHVYTGFGEADALPVDPDFTFSPADFFGQTEGWYFKVGAYNKTTVASGSSGAAIATITHLELIQPATGTVTGAGAAAFGGLTATASGTVTPANPGSGKPVLAQSSGVTFSGTGSPTAATAIAAELPGGATAGNILWFVAAGDKDITGATGPDGFTHTVFRTMSTQALMLAWKVAEGGETEASVAVLAGDNLSGSDCWFGEFEAPGSGEWEIRGFASSIPASGTDNVLAKSTGVTDTLTGGGYALAAWSVDSTDTEGTATYTPDTYVEIGNPTSGNAAHAGLWVAGHDTVASGTAAECTLTRGGGASADTLMGGIVVFARAGGEPPTEVQGAAVASLGALTSAAAGEVTAEVVTGAGTAAMGGLSAVASGIVTAEVVSGTAAAVLPGLNAAAAGTVTAEVVEGQALAPLGGLTAVAAGVRTVHAAGSASLPGLTATAAGTVTAEVVAGGGTAELGSVTSSAAGVRTTYGQASAPQWSLSAHSFGVGFTPVTGTASATLGGIAGTATGTVIAEVVTGSGSAPLGAVSAAADGVRGAAGAATAPLAGLVGSATGSGFASGTGAASAALGALTGAATGTVTIAGAASAALAFTATGTGVRATTGAAGAPLGGLTASAAGTGIAETVTGTGAAPLGGPTAAAAGVRSTPGTASAPLAGVEAEASGTGFAEGGGNATASLGGVTATAAGLVTRRGAATAGFGFTAAAASVRVTAGAATAAFDGLVASASATGDRRGAAVAALGGLTATATGVRGGDGAALAALGGLTAAAVGRAPGDGDFVCQDLTGTATAAAHAGLVAAVAHTGLVTAVAYSGHDIEICGREPGHE